LAFSPDEADKLDNEVNIRMNVNSITIILFEFLTFYISLPKMS